MNRLSTAGFVPPSVYIGFPLFVLAKGRSGQLSAIPKRARGTVGFWATRPVLPGPAAPRCPAVRSADPNRTWYVRVLDSTSGSTGQKRFVGCGFGFCGSSTCGRDLNSEELHTSCAIALLFPDMPCMKRIYKNRKAPVHWSAARDEERVLFRGKTAGQPDVLFPHRFT